MSLAVSSATGLGVLLMATLFPVMVNVGISRGAAAAMNVSTFYSGYKQPTRNNRVGKSWRNYGVIPSFAK
jgi:C4-dicarboxylate transporter